MWNGSYGFFDYKYNISGYSGQDYDGIMRWVYLVFSVVSIIILLIALRKASHKKIDVYIKVVAVLLPVLEVTKVTWESYWDITTGRGFNFCGLLPIYTCSLFMYCCICAAFGKGKVKECCLAWISTVGFVGGMSNVLFIQGLKWYPFLTFGAFHSMFFHYVMVFTSLFVVVTGYKKTSWSNIPRHLHRISYSRRLSYRSTTFSDGTICSTIPQGAFRLSRDCRQNSQRWG